MNKKSLKKKIVVPKKVLSQQSWFGRISRYILAAASGLGLVGVIFSQSVSGFCANSMSCIANMSAKVENNAVGVFDGQTITPPKIDLAADKTKPTVLGTESPLGEKHIYVDLDAQTLYAFQGSTLILNTLVSTGKWHPTPPGDYHIWVKIRSTRMSGGSGNDAYDLPNVPYVMFFYSDQVSKGQGFSLHGAYWHDNFGHEMSHGCVNMRPIDAQIIYDWASPTTVSTTTYATAQDPGTEISICQKVQVQEGSSPVCVE